MNELKIMSEVGACTAVFQNFYTDDLMSHRGPWFKLNYNTREKDVIYPSEILPHVSEVISIARQNCPFRSGIGAGEVRC